jgi:long-chain fatty acid transport protein
MRSALATLFVLGTAAPLLASGFELQDQSARATGMAGAVVATDNDPSAIFYNPGGLALFKKRKGVALGLDTMKVRESLYQGLPPGIGTGTASQQTTPTTTIPHAFLSLPFGKNIVYGVGTYKPFRMENEWADPNAFAGKFLATKSSIDALDVVPTAAIALSPNFGVGAGAIYRTSKIEVTRHFGSSLDGTLRDVGTLALKTDSEKSYGWTAGMQYRGKIFSWGASYRSQIDVDYVGTGRLTQTLTGDAQLDQLIAASLPFAQDIELRSRMQWPSQATFGIALTPNKPLLFEIDATRTNWSRIQTIPFTFAATPVLNTTYTLGFRDTTSYRGGIRFALPTGPQLRAGYRIEKSPQPDATVGAFFPDADRREATAGFGLDWLDVAFVWTRYQQRIITTSADQLNGNWRRNEYLIAVTATK